MNAGGAGVKFELGRCVKILASVAAEWTGTMQGWTFATGKVDAGVPTALCK